MHHRKYMSHDHYPLLCDVTVETQNTAFSIVACWTVFTELLPGNALKKSVTFALSNYLCINISSASIQYPLLKCVGSPQAILWVEILIFLRVEAS
jgi:hypothetical protein